MGSGTLLEKSMGSLELMEPILTQTLPSKFLNLDVQQKVFDILIQKMQTWPLTLSSVAPQSAPLVFST